MIYINSHGTYDRGKAMRNGVAAAATENDDFAATYGAFAAALDAACLSPAVIAAVQTNLLDTLACAVAGQNAAGVAEVRAMAESWGGAPQAGIWCSPVRVPAHHAAWVNGMMAHARDFDDTHDAAVLHAGVSVVPAALAAAELRPQTSGADLVAGLAAGLELICRLGVATTIGIIDSGFIYTSLFGYFGATAAAARVLGLSAAETTNALGIAYSHAAGTHQVTRDAALTKRMQPGLAAQAALVSAQLAQRGLSGAQRSFEGIDGLFRTYLRGGYDAEVLRRGLGTEWELLGLSYKPYPCCRFNHTAIDAALRVRAQPGFDLAAIERIHVGLNRQAYEAVCTPPDIRRHPRTIVQARFSIPFTVAAALLDGAVSLRHFTDDGVRRPDILALAGRVDCAVDPDIERDWGRTISPATLAVTAGNHSLVQRVDYPRGHPEVMLSAADQAAKLRDCLAFGGQVWPDDIAGRLQLLAGELAQLPAAAAVATLLANPPHPAA
jgi:2-methylcitrate dehydratase PrpD